MPKITTIEYEELNIHIATQEICLKIKNKTAIIIIITDKLKTIISFLTNQN